MREVVGEKKNQLKCWMLPYIMVFIIMFSSEVSEKTLWERYKFRALNVSEKEHIYLGFIIKVPLKKKKVIS